MNDDKSWLYDVRPEVPLPIFSYLVVAVHLFVAINVAELRCVAWLPWYVVVALVLAAGGLAYRYKAERASRLALGLVALMTGTGCLTGLAAGIYKLSFSPLDGTYSGSIAYGMFGALFFLLILGVGLALSVGLMHKVEAAHRRGIK